MIVLKSRYVAKNVNGIRTVVQNHHELPFLRNNEIKQFFILNAHWLGISVWDIGEFVDKLIDNSKVIDEYDEDWVKGGLNTVDKISHIYFKLIDKRMNLKIKISSVKDEKKFLNLMKLSSIRWYDNSEIDPDDTETDDGQEVYYIVDNNILTLVDSKWSFENASYPVKTIKEISNMKI